MFALLGIVAASRVPIDAVPDVTNVQVQVLTRAVSLGPIDVETYVTVPVERATSLRAGSSTQAAGPGC